MGLKTCITISSIPYIKKKANTKEAKVLHASKYLLLFRSGQKTYKAHYYNHMYETSLSGIEGKRHIYVFILKKYTHVHSLKCLPHGAMKEASSYTGSDIHNTLKNQAFKNHTYSCKNKVFFSPSILIWAQAKQIMNADDFHMTLHTMKLSIYKSQRTKQQERKL